MDFSLNDGLEKMTEDMYDRFNEEMDRIIKTKLVIAAKRSLEMGDKNLSEILLGISAGSKTREDVLSAGYMLELEKPDIDISKEGFKIKASINPDQLKIKIYKKVVEA